MKSSKTVDAYIKSFAPKIQKELRAIRRTIKQTVPKAEEKIAYGIPTFFQKKNLAHFATFKAHYGFFPGSAAIKAFKKELARFETSKGTIRFPHGKRIPHSLIRRIVKFNVKKFGGK